MAAVRKSQTEKQDIEALEEQVYNKAQEAVKETVESMKENAQLNAEAGKEALKNASGVVESTIKEKPFISLGCAFIAGLAIAKVLK